MKTITLTTIISETLHQKRLDAALAQLFPDYSRSLIQQWIRDGYVQLDNKIIKKTKQIVLTGQKINIDAKITGNVEWMAESIPLNIIYEDDALIIVNKPVGMVVHPGAGNPARTLFNALLHHAPELSVIPRAGIIHRLDKDTSGLLVVAKTLIAHHALIKQMQARDIEREYRAIVHGHIISGGTIDLPMGRHPKHRTKMAVLTEGKEAITHYRVLEHFREHTLLSVKLETGRTHQIRVHLAHKHYPIVGDATYSRQRQYPKLSITAQNALKNFHHQALHAFQLSLTHPITKKRMTWQAPLPKDFQKLLEVLRQSDQ